MMCKQSLAACCRDKGKQTFNCPWKLEKMKHLYLDVNVPDDLFLKRLQRIGTSNDLQY